MSFDGEVWKSIPGTIGYEASSLGRIRSFWARNGVVRAWIIGDEPHILKQSPSTAGYLCVSVKHEDGKNRKTPVHKLVATAFHGPRPTGMFACHHDDVKTNNTPENVRWKTPTENAADRYRNGFRAAKGQDHSQAKLTDDDIRKIRSMADSGLMQKVIAAELGIPASTVSRICRRVSWTHL